MELRWIAIVSTLALLVYFRMNLHVARARSMAGTKLPEQAAGRRMTNVTVPTRRKLLTQAIALCVALPFGQLAASEPVSAQIAPPNIDIGPKVGTRVPALNVRDGKGQTRSLKSVMGRRGVVLVFFRSAKWCPFCQAQLIALRDLPAQLAPHGYTLAAISYDPPEVLSGFIAKRDINYTLLSDAGSKTIDAFWLRDPQYKPDSMAYGVPQPSIFVISRDGVIRAKLAKEGYKIRPDNRVIVAAVQRLGSYDQAIVTCRAVSLDGRSPEAQVS